MAALPKKTPKNLDIPPPIWVKIPTSTLLSDSMTAIVITMATASLRILSPNTSMFSTGSTSRTWKMASVATGSTADIRHPKAKL